MPNRSCGCWPWLDAWLVRVHVRESFFASALAPSSSAHPRAVLSTIDKSSASSIHRCRPATAWHTKRLPTHRLVRRRRRQAATYNRLNDVAPLATDMNPTTRVLPPCSTDRTSRLPRNARSAVRLRSHTASVSDGTTPHTYTRTCTPPAHMHTYTYNRGVQAVHVI